MAKAPEAVEIKSDAWRRFERAVDTVVKGGPQHRVSGDKPKKDNEDGAPRSDAKQTKEGR